jgi:hypothetical protein
MIGGSSVLILPAKKVRLYFFAGSISTLEPPIISGYPISGFTEEAKSHIISNAEELLGLDLQEVANKKLRTVHDIMMTGGCSSVSAGCIKEVLERPYEHRQ